VDTAAGAVLFKTCLGGPTIGQRLDDTRIPLTCALKVCRLA
jgi:hypothetical protein